MTRDELHTWARVFKRSGATLTRQNDFNSRCNEVYWLINRGSGEMKDDLLDGDTAKLAFAKWIKQQGK